MDKNTKIAIIGGGIGGLSVAACLRKAGFKRIDVFERADEFREVGAAISCWPNALRVIEWLGLLDQVVGNAGIINEAFIRTAEGKVLQHVTMKYDLPAICVHRADLHEALLQLSPEKSLHTNHELKSITQRRSGVRLEFGNGNQVRADVLIGADGIRSKVRELLFDPAPPVHRGYNIWRGVVKIGETYDRMGGETWGRGARVGIVPIRQGTVGWWATVNEGEEAISKQEDTRSRLKEIFGSWHDPIPELIQKTEHILKNGIYDRPPRQGWGENNTVLLGDAAHPTTPNLGQGACMAIEGAFLLSACMGKYHSIEEAAAKYEKKHFPRTRKVIKESLMNGKVGQLEGTLATGLRNTMVNALPAKMAAKSLDKYFSYDVTEVELM